MTPTAAADKESWNRSLRPSLFQLARGRCSPISRMAWSGLHGYSNKQRFPLIYECIPSLLHNLLLSFPHDDDDDILVTGKSRFVQVLDWDAWPFVQSSCRAFRFIRPRVWLVTWHLLLRIYAHSLLQWEEVMLVCIYWCQEEVTVSTQMSPSCWADFPNQLTRFYGTNLQHRLFLLQSPCEFSFFKFPSSSRKFTMSPVNHSTTERLAINKSPNHSPQNIKLTMSSTNCILSNGNLNMAGWSIIEF